MTITFVTNFVHHHQLPLADELYARIGVDYHYIATKPLPEWLINGGYDPNLNRPYIVRSYESEMEMDKARGLIDESDVVIVGEAPEEWILKRKDKNKVTFHYSERWLKKIDYHIFSPRSLYNIYRNYYRYRHKRTYMLCASAFAAQDVHRYGCFPNRCFKWGYFTAVDEKSENEALQDVSNSKKTSFMWCARFLDWKHPELPVLLAARLKAKGYKFSIDIFGNGEEFEKIKKLIEDLDVSDYVNLCGNRPNAEILQEMRKHSIFLFTSDRNEGWGAVLNEAMSNGCIPVASDDIGSVPYLIKNDWNGLRFRSCSIDSLEEKVCRLLEDKVKMQELSQNALRTMREKWAPKVAAHNFLELAQYILSDKLDLYKREDGPASWDR